MKKIKTVLFLVVVLSMALALAYCNDDTVYAEQNLNYEDSYYWISSPSSVEKDVDVFYVYPTVSSNASGSMDVTNDEDRALAQGIFKAQASVFEKHANIYAPYYRQMSTKVQMPEDPNALATDTKEFKQGAADVEEAFEYYIANLNDSRPFIIAGHSQGTMALIELIKNRFGDNEELRNQLVAAYLIGYTVTDSDLSLSELTAAQQADDIGVVITYNTQSDTSAGGPMLLPGAHCINPLNWRTDNSVALASENLGARFYNDATGELIREVNNYCGAQINTEAGALTTTIPKGEELDIGPYTEGVYHRYDYAFWYRNLQKNVGDRINAFLNQHGIETSIPPEPNYTMASVWVTKPEKIDKDVDVFFVYPTIYMDEYPENMDTSDPALRDNAKGLLTAQAGVYSPYANLFAPFYRQQSTSSQSMEPNNGGKDAFVDPIFLVGYRDVERAFDYYLKYLNKDRPFILAGHSQGSVVIINLLRNRFNNPDICKRLVAAYPIGYSLTINDLNKYPWMKLAQEETDTGVIITFNTQGINAEGSPVLLDGAVAVNPLNWKTDSTPVGREDNIKAKFFNDATGELIEEIPHFAGAYIDENTGALIATDIQPIRSKEIDIVNMGRWPTEVYHRYDYSFWYDNIKENVKKRIDAYLKK